MTRTAEIAAARAADEQIAAEWAKFWEIQNQVIVLQHTIRETHKTITRMGERDYYLKRITDAEIKLATLRDKADILRGKAQNLDKELYTGWSRFFLVEHIHNTMHCSSFRPTTRVGWLPKVSGLTEKEAVAEYGPNLCTKCFPSAPVEWTRGVVDDTLCAGSGKPYDSEQLTGREQSYYSPSGTCSVCGKTVGLTARHSGKVRKHKA